MRPFGTVLYADDTTLLCSGRDYNEAVVKMTAAEERVCVWFAANGLKVNTLKTQRIILTSNTSVCRGDAVRVLGILVDESLGWKDHIGELCKRLSKQLFLLRHLSRSLAGPSLISAYYGLIHSHITYGLLIW